MNAYVKHDETFHWILDVLYIYICSSMICYSLYMKKGKTFCTCNKHKNNKMLLFVTHFSCS
jgi:hypothetical protein